MRTRRLDEDDRGIEGLPVRLVIALVVGVASLGVMLNMVSGLSGLGVTEVDVAPEPEVTTSGAQQVTVRVVGPDGDRVANATVVARGGSAQLDGPVVAQTDQNGTATMQLDPKLGANQAEGTVQFSVKPPAGGPFVDRRGNTALLVVRG
ncbi:MAG: carboxypeptidase regulatory-like domain-containing protein [Haloglomus sp.]